MHPVACRAAIDRRQCGPSARGLQRRRAERSCHPVQGRLQAPGARPRAEGLFCVMPLRGQPKVDRSERLLAAGSAEAAAERRLGSPLHSSAPGSSHGSRHQSACDARPEVIRTEGAIGATTTKQGLRVHAERDTGSYPKEVTVSNTAMAAIDLQKHDWHGEWNYIIRPDGRRGLTADL